MPVSSDFIATATLPVANRFAGIIDGLCRAVATLSARDRSAGPLIMLIYSRLRRLSARFAALAAHARAGTLPGVRRRRAGRARSVRSPRLLPEGFGWLVTLVPEAAGFGAQLQHLLLTDPEMAAVLEAAPGVGRVLRAVCRMTGIRAPAVLRREGVASVAPAIPPVVLPAVLPVTFPGRVAGACAPAPSRPRSHLARSHLARSQLARPQMRPHAHGAAGFEARRRFAGLPDPDDPLPGV